MPMMPLLTAVLEKGLNLVLWRDRGLKNARQRLKGKILSLTLRELNHPLVIYFGEQQIDVLSQQTDDIDCSVSLSLSVLPELRQRENLPALIKQGRLEVSGDLQVIQQFSALIDLAEFDPAEYLAPWIGDIAAQTLSQAGERVVSNFKLRIQRKPAQLSELITEEWRSAPSQLEVAWFVDQNEFLAQRVIALEHRLANQEK